MPAGSRRSRSTTGAQFAASEEEAPLLARGGKGDYLLGDKQPFQPMKADRILKDGDTVTLGGSTLTAHLTPGHTRDTRRGR